MKAKSELPGCSEESAEVPPGGSKDHGPNCGWRKASDSSEGGQELRNSLAPAKTGFRLPTL